jgi:hypothetical protein
MKIAPVTRRTAIVAMAIVFVCANSSAGFTQRRDLSPDSMPTGTGISFVETEVKRLPAVYVVEEDDLNRGQAPFYWDLRDGEAMPWVTKITETRELSPEIARAIAFRDFMLKSKVEEILCLAFQEMFNLAPGSHCLDSQYNSAKTVLAQVVISDDVRKIYEVEVRGKSELLALRIPNWTERHRFYVQCGYGGDMRPYLVVWDAEPLMKNTSNVDDTDDKQYQAVDRAKYDLIRSFQEKTKSMIAKHLRTRFEAYLLEAQK